MASSRYRPGVVVIHRGDISVKSHVKRTAKELAGRITPIRDLRQQRNRLAAEVKTLQDEVAAGQRELVATREQLAALTHRLDARPVTVEPPEVEPGGPAPAPGPGQAVVETEGTVTLGFPLGHYYSPIPDLDQIRARDTAIFDGPFDVPGIDFEPARQLERLGEFAGYFAELPYPETGKAPWARYTFDNGFFSYGDAAAYYCMLRSIRPRSIIEIGSGWSSALALDINELFLGGATQMTFIEPYPERLESLITDTDRDRTRIIREPLYRVDPELFETLQPGDILFVDSTHVSKTGSDVNQIILEILPRLRPGIHVHVHDIFYPFEYPREWVYEGRAWNENYLLRAFLTLNEHIRISWFNSYLARFHYAAVADVLPLWSRNTGGSIWLETV